MIMSLKQRKIKFEPRIKLNHNIYTRGLLGCLLGFSSWPLGKNPVGALKAS